MLYTYEATKLDHRMHQEKPVGNYMYVVSNPLFMHYGLLNNILLNRNRHLLKTNILDVRLYTDFLQFSEGLRTKKQAVFAIFMEPMRPRMFFKLQKKIMQAKFCEIKEYFTQFMQKLCNSPQIEFSSFEISISRKKWLRKRSKLTFDSFVYSLSIFSKLFVPKCPISLSLLDFSDPLAKVNFTFLDYTVYFAQVCLKKGLNVFGSSFFSKGSINSRCGHVVRDFESEAKTRYNF